MINIIKTKPSNYVGSLCFLSSFSPILLRQVTLEPFEFANSFFRFIKLIRLGTSSQTKRTRRSSNEIHGHQRSFFSLLHIIERYLSFGYWNRLVPQEKRGKGGGSQSTVLGSALGSARYYPPNSPPQLICFRIDLN